MYYIYCQYQWTFLYLQTVGANAIQQVFADPNGKHSKMRFELRLLSPKANICTDDLFVQTLPKDIFCTLQCTL